MDGVWPPTIDDVDELQRLVNNAKDFAFAFGILMRTPQSTSSADLVAHAPFTLFPTPVPRHSFTQAQSVQTDFNLLMYRVATNHDFLYECLHRVIETDEYTRRLWNICEAIRQETAVQPLMLAMNRSDYMIGAEATDDDDDERADTNDDLKQPQQHHQNGEDCNGYSPTMNGHCSVVVNDAHSMTRPPGEKTRNHDVCLKQIEFNTMSAGASGLAHNVNKLHRFLFGRVKCNASLKNVPVNEAVFGLADAMVTAWRFYGNASAVILFLVYTVEPNVYDQRWHEYAIHTVDSSVKVIRRTLQEMTARATMTSDRRLVIDDMEVAVIYMRSCYKPSDYQTDDDWKTRLTMERSRAVVCPTAAYHLAGTKKVQQMLSAPGVVERFIDDQDAVDRIRSTFAAQYTLDLTEEGDRNAEMAVNKPQLFVMKPQREGGGNNLYGDAIKEELLKKSSDRESYILMKRINPLVVRNYPVAWQRSVEQKTMVSEIGIFGTLIANGDEILVNKELGYLMRTKQLGNNEGGLMSGSAFVDSPYLI